METPDGPWAWGVLVAALLTNGLTLGFPSCIGVFYKDLQNSFQVSNSEISWFPSIITAVLHAGGPLCSFIVEKFGCRVAVMAGGLLCGIGMVTSSFSQTIIHLYLSAGIIGGLGLCFSFQGAITVLGYYFIKRRTLANSLASTGASIGMALWPIASQHLLESMGWRGSFMIFGGVLLNCCVCGAIMRPVKAPPPAPSKDGANGVTKGVEELEQGKGLQRYIAFDLLLRHRRYQIYTIGVSGMVMGFVLPLFYLVPYATSNGIDHSTAALLLSLIGFINIFTRPLSGLVSQQRIFSGKLIYLFSGAVIVNGLCNLICASSASFPVLIVYCVMYGISMSVIGSLLFQVLMDIVGMKRFPGAFGLFTIMESVTILLGPPLAGLLVDITGEYKLVFYFTCLAVTLSGLFIFVASYIVDKKERETKNNLFAQNDTSGTTEHPNVIYRPATKQEDFVI
ncbi:monocarboxylate transporter 6 [Bufo gargarizans]|uniref:monocarboxylate transporter 6 n=1 Tax=Bufo gargarizans TaxID=30331 RepID=UPI001CF2D074|nr:monocarboxylate transporter 6 [Bufo gargarizans]XP_044153745.1 monocarboxylate transporter 6 [Bufo gargarizans]